jgi:uncharacterized membrane protein
MTGLISLDILRRLYEFGLIGLFVLVFARCVQTRGWKVTVRELAFGFTLTQGVELLAVSMGRYNYPDWVPLGIGLAWAAGAPCIMRVSEGIVGAGAALWKLALLDGFIAVGLDLILDPAVSGEPLRMWVWRGPEMYQYRYWLLDVPVFNFVGWVVLIGACGYELRKVAEMKTESERWKKLGLFLVIDMAIAFAVMLLPW